MTTLTWFLIVGGAVAFLAGVVLSPAVARALVRGANWVAGLFGRR